MAAPYDVPLTRIPLLPNQNQSLSVNLNGTDYRMRLILNELDPFGTGTGTWVLDIGDAEGNILVAGIPLLPRQNLLDPYDYLEIGGGGALFCAGPNIAPDPLPSEGLGVEWFLYFAPPTNAPSALSGLSFVPPGFGGASLS